MTVDHRKDYLESVRSQLSMVVYPIQYLVTLPIKAGDLFSESMETRNDLMHENAQLKAQNLLLSNHTQKYQSLELENQRLRGLIESPIRQGERVLVADLLAVEHASSAHKFVLNKGSRSGLYLGQPIVDSSGVVGQIVHIGPMSSTGMMVTDKDHAIPVEVMRSGVRAIATGQGYGGEMRLDYVPQESDIKEGDLLVSSGLGGHFPKGYPVAKVSQVTLDPGENFMVVKVKPVASLTRAREVLLLWPGITDVDAAGPSRVAASTRNSRSRN